MNRRRDPGPCPVCGAAHTACTAGDASVITQTMLPARDGVAGGVVVQTNDRAVAAAVVKHPDAFTTKTYPKTLGGRQVKRRPRR